MAQPVGEPSRGHLEGEYAQVPSGQERRDERGREAALLDEPDEVDAVQDAFNRGDVIRQVEPEVPAEASVRRHEKRII